MSQRTQPFDWTAVLDEETIASLRELGGEDDPQLLAELVDLFSGDSPARLTGMREGVEQDDLVRVEAMAHALKSSSANVGALRLSDLCRRCESSAKAGNGEETRTLVQELETEFDRVLIALRHAVDCATPGP